MVFWPARLRLRPANRPNSGVVAGLLRRIAGADPAAFADLHARLRPRLVVRLAAVPLGPVDVIAVADATFVEVWRLAPHWSGPDRDALAWVYAIAARRSADRWATRTASLEADARPVDVLAPLDRQMGLELDTLLAPSTNTAYEC
jgi:DNA-directed RNA polymerase specialized sigma24 family protein